MLALCSAEKVGGNGSGMLYLWPTSLVVSAVVLSSELLSAILNIDRKIHRLYSLDVSFFRLIPWLAAQI